MLAPAAGARYIRSADGAVHVPAAVAAARSVRGSGDRPARDLPRALLRPGLRRGHLAARSPPGRAPVVVGGRLVRLPLLCGLVLVAERDAVPRPPHDERHRASASSRSGRCSPSRSWPCSSGTSRGTARPGSRSPTPRTRSSWLSCGSARACTTLTTGPGRSRTRWTTSSRLVPVRGQRRVRRADAVLAVGGGAGRRRWRGG